MANPDTANNYRNVIFSKKHMSFENGRGYRLSPSFIPEPQTKKAESQSYQHDGRRKREDFITKDNRLASKEERLDEQFRSLLNQSNRSKQNIDLAYQSKTATNQFPSTLSSPTRDMLPVYSIPKSPDYSLNDTQRVPNVSNNKLEREIQDLKSTVLDRIRRQEAETQAQIAKDRKASRKAKIESLSSLDDTNQLEEETQHTASSKQNLKTERNTQRNVKSAKSPDVKALQLKKGQNVEQPVSAKSKKSGTSKSKAKSKSDEADPELIGKYRTLKHKAKEMRSMLQQYVENYSDLEELVEKKDRVLFEYEDQVKQSQQELLKNFEILQEMKRNEDIALKSQEDLRVQNNDLKARIQDQTKKLDELEVQIKQNEDKYHTQLEGLRNEKHELKINLKDREQQLDQLSSSNEKLRSEVDYLQREYEKNEAYVKKLQAQNEKNDEDLKDLGEKADQLQTENKELYLKNEELKENKAHLEEKLAKYKKKTEEEHVKWETEREKEVENRKEKNKQLKANIKELESILQRATDEKKELAHELERNLLHKVQLDKEVHNLRDELLVAHQETNTARANVELLRTQNEELTKNYQKESDKSLNVQTEGRKMTKALQGLEEKLVAREKDLAKSDELNARLRNEVKVLAGENEGAKEYIAQLEFRFVKQEEDMTKFEAKLGELEHEILNIRDENTLLKSKETSLTKEIEALKAERDNYKIDCKSLKQMNKNLERDLREVDERVREFMQGKQTELQEYNKENAIQKQLNSKIKMLEDIQSMIRSHGQSHRTKIDFTDSH